MPDAVTVQKVEAFRGLARHAQGVLTRRRPRLVALPEGVEREELEHQTGPGGQGQAESHRANEIRLAAWSAIQLEEEEAAEEAAAEEE